MVKIRRRPFDNLVASRQTHYCSQLVGMGKVPVATADLQVVDFVGERPPSYRVHLRLKNDTPHRQLPV